MFHLHKRGDWFRCRRRVLSKLHYRPLFARLYRHRPGVFAVEHFAVRSQSNGLIALSTQLRNCLQFTISLSSYSLRPCWSILWMAGREPPDLFRFNFAPMYKSEDESRVFKRVYPWNVDIFFFLSEDKSNLIYVVRIRLLIWIYRSCDFSFVFEFPILFVTIIVIYVEFIWVKTSWILNLRDMNLSICINGIL